MHRSRLLSLLYNYPPSSECEKTAKKNIIAFVKANPLCFERSLETGHITGSAWVLNKKGTHALLTHHAKFDIWCQLGGHCDGDPDVLAVALKEAREESGVDAIKPIRRTIFDIDIHEVPRIGKEKSHFHYDIRFLLQLENDQQVKVSHESKALKWISKNASDIPAKSCTSVIRMFDKWITEV